MRPLRYLGFTSLFALAACASQPAATSSTASTSSTPAGSASGGSAYRVLFTASTTSTNDIFLYDSASSTPQKIVSLPAGAPPQPRFVSAQKVAYIEPVSQTVSRITSFDLSSRAGSVVATATGYIPAFAFKHDGSAVAYLDHDLSASKAALRIHGSGSSDFSMQLNSIPGRGVGRDDELRLEYSPDDKYLLMVDTFIGNQAQAPETGQFLVLRTSDNTVAFLPPSGVSANATMGLWAHNIDRLYYRDAVGVRSWDAGVTSVGTAATALHWYDPATSPDNKSIAFTDIDAQFVPHIKLLDMGTNQVTTLATPARSHPIFISVDVIWSLEEQACQSECLAGPSVPSGKVMAYNLKSKTESALPFTDIKDLSALSVSPR